jgi:hypothetical protein
MSLGKEGMRAEINPGKGVNEQRSTDGKRNLVMIL